MRPVRTLATLTALTGLTLTPAIGSASAPGDSYVALGDSYSSGTGTKDYLDDGSTCQRSALAYPSLIAAADGSDLNLRACSGATTADVTNSQLSALGDDTDRVSISVGGNDAGFADVLTECAKPAWASSCDTAIDGAETTIASTLPGRLDSLYAEIRAKAPNATVVVVGYPRIFMGEDCNALTWFSPEEQTRLNATADLLNSTLESAASRAGFSFADPTSAFTGHAVCDDTEWINGLANPVGESYHPNRAGHRDGYTPVVSSPLTGARADVTPATTDRAEASAAEQAERQRGYATEDRTITPKTVRLPDLDSPEMKAAAQRAGVDLDSRASIDAADRVWTKRQVAARR
ncbi:MAG TPA: SGNH/GDSL hydrolase family protein [Candidatus Janibacter merdipullorum]|nr:SGNH/GDSL hydrolase family protein [Candidatus Janibacter merdipullorum]